MRIAGCILGVRLVALDAAGRVFLVRHSYLPGLHLPGGAVDAGETCREAAEREAREEGGLGLDAPPELFHVYRIPPAAGTTSRCSSWRAAPARPGRAAASLEIIAAGFHAARPAPADVTPGHPPPPRRGARRTARPADVW